MNEANKKFSLKAGSKLVVKIGTSVITNNGESISNGILKRIASQIRFLHVRGIRVILVSSGAIAAGVFKIGWRKRPKKISKLQAAAAVGQVNLIKAYETEFGINGLKTAVGIDDDTPADELFDKTVQALEFGAMGIALDKIFPIIKNIKKFRRADQAAVSVGGAAAAGEAVSKVSDNIGNNNISQTTEKE